MSQPITWVFVAAILPGQFEAFLTVRTQLIEHSKAEPGLIVYEWFISEDQTTCHIFETFRDSEAILAHLKAFVPFAEPLMKAIRPTYLHVHGPINDEAKAAIASFNPIYLASLGGFRR